MNSMMQQEEFTARLYVGGLPKPVKQEVLREYFETFGKLVDVYLPKGGMAGYGFVSFESRKDMYKVLATEEHDIGGIAISLNEALPKSFGRDVPPMRSRREETRVFVGGLPPSATKEDLRSVCEPFGELLDVYIPRDYNTHKSKGYGFVTFAQRSFMYRMLGENLVLDGNELKTSHAAPKPHRTAFSGHEPDPYYDYGTNGIPPTGQGYPSNPVGGGGYDGYYDRMIPPVSGSGSVRSGSGGGGRLPSQGQPRGQDQGGHMSVGRMGGGGIRGRGGAMDQHMANMNLNMGMGMGMGGIVPREPTASSSLYYDSYEGYSHNGANNPVAAGGNPGVGSTIGGLGAGIGNLSEVGGAEYNPYTMSAAPRRMNPGTIGGTRSRGPPGPRANGQPAGTADWVGSGQVGEAMGGYAPDLGQPIGGGPIGMNGPTNGYDNRSPNYSPDDRRYNRYPGGY